MILWENWNLDRFSLVPPSQPRNVTQSLANPGIADGTNHRNSPNVFRNHGCIQYTRACAICKVLSFSNWILNKHSHQQKNDQVDRENCSQINSRNIATIDVLKLRLHISFKTFSKFSYKASYQEMKFPFPAVWDPVVVSWRISHWSTVISTIPGSCLL